MEMIDEIDREQLITKHISYAASVARGFSRRRRQFGVEWDELYGAALFGLVDAAQRYEPSHGVAFDRYSTARIRGAMVDMLRRGGWHNWGYLKFATDPSFADDAEEMSSAEPLPSDISSSDVASPPASRSAPGASGKPALSGEVAWGEPSSENPVSGTPLSGRTGSGSGKHSAARKLPLECVMLLQARTAAEFVGIAGAIDRYPNGLFATPPECGGDDPELLYAEPRCPEQCVMNANMRAYLASLLPKLAPDESRLLRLHYFEGRSFEQMRFEFRGASKATLSRLHRRALANLRRLIEEDGVSCSRRLASHEELSRGVAS